MLLVLVADLVGVGNFRTAIACITNSIIVPIVLVRIWHSLAVVQEIFQTWKPGEIKVVKGALYPMAQEIAVLNLK